MKYADKIIESALYLQDQLEVEGFNVIFMGISNSPLIATALELAVNKSSYPTLILRVLLSNTTVTRSTSTVLMQSVLPKKVNETVAKYNKMRKQTASSSS